MKPRQPPPQDPLAPAPAQPRGRGWVGLVVVVLLASAGSQWYGARQQRQLGQVMAAAAGPGDIQMLSSTTCAICTTARVWLEQHEVKFDECFIENDATCAARFEATRAPGTPVIFVRGQPLLGFDPRRMQRALEAG